MKRYLGQSSCKVCPWLKTWSSYWFPLVVFAVVLLGISEENLAKLCEHAQIPSDYRLVFFFPQIFNTFAHTHKKLYKQITKT